MLGVRSAWDFWSSQYEISVPEAIEDLSVERSENRADVSRIATIQLPDSIPLATL